MHGVWKSQKKVSINIASDSLRSNSLIDNLIGEKVVENTKLEKLQCDNLGDFQTLWAPRKLLTHEKS